MIGRRDFISLLGGAGNQVVRFLATLARKCMNNAVHP